MRYVSLAWFLLTLVLSGLTYSFLGINYEQSIHQATIVFLTSLGIYTFAVLIYWFMKRRGNI